ncbi:MAG: hypothetical protein IKO61_08660 [Lachnospiraceae bacterium]|nr:hypothetical protein [Lachnospiraceae bacterium]
MNGFIDRFRKRTAELLGTTAAPYIIYGALVLVMHVVFFIYHGDDIRALNSLESSTGFSDWGFKEENARNIINFLTYYVLKAGTAVFIVLDTIIMVVIYNTLHYLVFSKRTVYTRYIMLLCLLLFPFHLSVSVGWVLTPIAYIWTFMCACIACITVRRYFEHKENGLIICVLITPFLIFASDKEDLAVVMFVVFAYMFARSVKDKRISAAFAYEALVSAGFIAHALTQRNIDRLEVTTERLHFYEYLDIGFTGTLQEMIFDYDFVFFVVLLLISALVIVGIKKTALGGGKKYAGIAAALLSVALWIVFGFYLGLVRADIFDEYVYDGLIDSRTITEGKYDSAVNIFYELAVLVIWILLFVNIYHAFDASFKARLLSVLLFAGICGRTTVGFAGNHQFYFERTFLFLYYIFIIIASVASSEIYERVGTKGRQRLFEFLGFAALCVVVGIVYNLEKYYRLSIMYYGG